MGYLIVVTDYIEQKTWVVSCYDTNDVYKYFDFLNDTDFIKNFISRGHASITHTETKYLLLHLEDYI